MSKAYELDGVPMPATGNPPIIDLLIMGHVHMAGEVFAALRMSGMPIPLIESALKRHASVLREYGGKIDASSEADGLANGVEVLSLAMATEASPLPRSK